MIGYVTLGTKDLQKAAAFYDKIAAEMGIGRFMESDTFIAWGSAGGGAGLGVTKPFDGKPMTAGNGVMVALAAKDKAQVDRLYKLALSLAAPMKALPVRAARADSTPPISGTPRATSSTPS
jgi:catechol 2,3-dioxygenase-like lactoylglutathione lyase family enzyme